MTQGAKGGPPASHDGELRIPLDPASPLGQKLKTELPTGGLYLPCKAQYSLRSRILIVFEAGNVQIPMVGEVVFQGPDGLGLQVVSFDDDDRHRLAEVLQMPAAAAPPPAPAAPSPPAAAPIHTEPRPAAAPQPAAAPRRAAPSASGPISIPLTGTIKCDLPSLMLRAHASAAGQPVIRGTVDLQSLFGVMVHLSEHAFTGTLQVTEPDKAETRIYLSQGKIVGADRKPADELSSAAYFLKKQGALRESDFREVRVKAKQGAESEDRLLLHKVGEAAFQVGGRMALYKKVGRTFGARSIDYVLTPGSDWMERVVPVKAQLKRLLFRGFIDAAAVTRSEELMQGMQPFMSAYLQRAEKPPFDVSTLRFDANEMRFWEVTLKKPTLLRNVFAVSALSKLHTLQTIYALFFLGLAEFNTLFRPEEQDLLPHLKHERDEMAKMTHFDILQTHWSELPDGIKLAYEKVRRYYQEMPLPKTHHAEAEALIRQILAKIDESWQYLSDDDRRKKYREGLLDKIQIQFGADLLADHARTYIFQGNFKLAREFIKKALDLFPNSGEFRQIANEAERRG
jgi:hypothetical protein